MNWRAIGRLATRAWGWLRRRREPPPAVPARPILALAAPRARRTAPELPPVICLPGPPPAAVAAPVARRQPGRPRKTSVARLKRDILDQLDTYQTYIRRLQRWDAQAYAQYRRLGAYICHPDHEAALRKLEPALVETLPAFGAVAMGLGKHHEEPINGEKYVPIRFAYFTQLNRPGSDVERVNIGTTYRCHLYWDDVNDKHIDKRGRGIGKDILVNVAPDGTLRALRTLKMQTQTVRHKRGRWRGSTSTVHHQRWGLPDIRDDTLLTEQWQKKQTLADYIVTTFCLVANFWLASARNSMIRVTATKDDVVMPFVVDITNTPAFFRDREPVIVNGVRKRVFHVRRAHVRRGTERGVRLHFAGLSEFTWNGYQIAITVPGRDHVDLADASFGAIEDVLGPQIPDGMVEMAEMAEIMADHIGAPAKQLSQSDGERISHHGNLRV